MMKTEKWKMMEKEFGGFILTHGNITLFFDDIAHNGVTWSLFRNGDLVAELGGFDKKIVDYTGYIEKNVVGVK